MTSKEVFQKLASINVRIFGLTINRDLQYFVHPDKTTEQWRKDVRSFKPSVFEKDDDLCAVDHILNGLYKHLHDLGYEEVDDVCADVFEGRVVAQSAKLVDDPVHWDKQEDGFGHYGWESK